MFRQVASAVRSFWERIGTNHEQIKILLAVLTISVAFIQYRAARHEFQTNLEEEMHKRRVEAALGYIDRYQDGEPLEAQQALGRFWSSEEGERVNLRGSDALEQVKIATFSNHLDGHVRALQRFYRVLSICSLEAVCDARTMCAFFFRDVNSFGNTYRSLLSDWSKEWNEDMSLEATRFLAEVCSDQLKSYRDQTRLDNAKQGTPVDGR